MPQAIPPAARAISRSSPQALCGKRAISREDFLFSSSRASWPQIISGFTRDWQARAQAPNKAAAVAKQPIVPVLRPRQQRNGKCGYTCVIPAKAELGLGG